MEFKGKLAIQQRVLPSYRAPFFDLLARSCRSGLSILAGKPGPEESISSAERLETANLTLSSGIAPFAAANPFYFLWQNALPRWLEREDPDVLILEANSRYLSNRFAVHWMHARGRKVIGWGLGVPPISGRGLFSSFRRWERSSYLRSLDGMIAYSRRGKAEYQTLGFSPDRVWQAQNAAAPRPVDPPPERPVELSRPPVVLFVGRLQARKRIDLLLQACAGLPPSLQPRLILVGDGPARSEMQDLARQVFPQAEFTGAQHGPDLANYFRQADLFVLPGTGGLAVQQAMAFGLPVIVAEADGTQEDLVRPENGVILPPGDVQALKTALEAALSDIPRLRRMGQASYQIASEDANLEKMVQVFLQAASEMAR